MSYHTGRNEQIGGGELGPKVEKPKAERPEWVPHPDRPGVEVNTKTGALRTRPRLYTEAEIEAAPVDIQFAMRKANGQPWTGPVGQAAQPAKPADSGEPDECVGMPHEGSEAD